MNEFYQVNWARTENCPKYQLTKPGNPNDAGWDLHAATDSIVLPYSMLDYTWELLKDEQDNPRLLTSFSNVIQQHLSNKEHFKVDENDFVYRRKYKFNYVDTGVRLQPELLQWFGVYSRSSSSKYAIGLGNSVGVVDNIYSDSVKVALYSYEYPTLVQRGERIAQLVPHPQLRCGFVEIPEDVFVENLKTRGTRAGFGSTGTF